ncbi:hypothetical protein G7Y89_g3990 [Cudoniella acicularis]|uniref:Zn(2)-C6 fungal-type domain-containing protein n=1 Tax=Cudoniella acicularis TaxID=354080 RepID=A0A8H4RS87_9HELO|nr:hypothetical protein G7Y89_g3990 [Cudoniella acicularis]
MPSTCPDLDAPNTLWNFCPNVDAAYLFAILFASTTIAHFTQAIVHKKVYSWVIVVSGLAQTIAYIFRIISINNPSSLGPYAAWFVLILIAPVFTNAYVYMIMGRMVWNYITEAKIYKVTAWRMGTYFVILDIVALLIQVYGAASASGNNIPTDQILQGLHIYMGGVGFQQAFIVLFFVFAIKFHRTLLSQNPLSISSKPANSPFPLLYTIYVVLVLITTRIIFRLAEYAQGLNSSVPNHEAFQYCLDSLPMFIALVLLNVVHPGRVMSGKETDIPGRKQRKAQGLRGKMETRRDPDIPLTRTQRSAIRSKKPIKHNATLRHVKCDEERPSCLKCSSTGRKCDGYDPSTNPNVTTGSSSPTDLIRSPSTGVTGLFASDNEHRSFCFFVQNTAPQLTGFDADGFWDGMVLQATHHEPAIRHAIIALGSLHERFVGNQGLISRSDHDGFALRQYNTAIKCLVKPFSRPGRQAMDVCLISSILFACFETMQGNYGPAIAHMQSGGKILCEIEYDEQSKQHQHEVLRAAKVPYVPMDTLEDILMRLDFQVTQMIGKHNYSIYERSMRTRPRQNIPSIFSSLSEARESFIFNWHNASYALKVITRLEAEEFHAAFAAWQKSAIPMLDQWTQGFENFIEARGDTLTDSEKRGIAVLRLQKNAAFISVHLTRMHPRSYDDQTVWDGFFPIFEETVQIAGEIIDSISSDQPWFCLDMQINGPLYQVVSRCRDPPLRRKAIQLLKNTPRLEGIWHSFLVAKVAERVVQIEEDGLGDVTCASDIPDWARISDVQPIFHPNWRRATLYYSRWGSMNDVVRKSVKEVMEW